MRIFSAKDEDFQVTSGPNGSTELAPLMALPGMSGGIARWQKGETALKDWTYWYPEVVYVISGSGRITAADPPFSSTQTYDVTPGDFFYIAPGTRVSFEASSDEPLQVFYAVPG